MNYYTCPPSKKLKGLVRFFWVFEMDDVSSPYIYRSMADPCCEMIFHYKGRFNEITETGKQNSSFLSGIHAQSHQYRRFITEESFGIFGVYLYPFAAQQLLGLSPSELTNQMPDLYSAFGNNGKELEERIFLAPNNDHRCRILSDFLEHRFSKFDFESHPVQTAVRYVIHSKQNHTVRDLADHFNLSERQFVRKFKEYSGFTPKKYLRLVRFGAACDHFSEIAYKSMTEIAHICGYYDQAHFIKEFKTFSGFLPTDYFYGNSEGTEWRESL